MENFEKYMTPPEPPMVAIEKDGWLYCPYCGKKIFPVNRDTAIHNLEWVCKNSKCKQTVLIEKDSELEIIMDEELTRKLLQEHIERIKRQPVTVLTQ